MGKLQETGLRQEGQTEVSHMIFLNLYCVSQGDGF